MITRLSFRELVFMPISIEIALLLAARMYETPCIGVLFDLILTSVGRKLRPTDVVLACTFVGKLFCDSQERPRKTKPLCTFAI